MQVQFELTVGKNKFTLVENVDSHTDFFKKMSFYSTLPKVGPNGEEDLVIQHRVAQKQYDYYSIVCPSAKMEFKFGQVKEGKGTLFAKGWEPLYQGDGETLEEGESSAPPTGLGGGLGAPRLAPAPAPTHAASAPTPAPASAAAQNNAKNVLAKFGLN